MVLFCLTCWLDCVSNRVCWLLKWFVCVLVGLSACVLGLVRLSVCLGSLFDWPCCLCACVFVCGCVFVCSFVWLLVCVVCSSAWSFACLVVCWFCWFVRLAVCVSLFACLCDCLFTCSSVRLV